MYNLKTDLRKSLLRTHTEHTRKNHDLLLHDSITSGSYK